MNPEDRHNPNYPYDTHRRNFRQDPTHAAYPAKSMQAAKIPQIAIPLSPTAQMRKLGKLCGRSEAHCQTQRGKLLAATALSDPARCANCPDIAEYSSLVESGDDNK
jgi:hypothetical protein